MKTYRNLYNEAISDNNIEQAIIEASRSHTKNKAKKAKLKSLRNNPHRIEIVRSWIETYETRKCKPVEMIDGPRHKKRLKYVPTLKETVVQHAVVIVLEKHLGSSRYEHSYASIKKRGQYKGMKQIKKWIRHHPKSVKYYFKGDIRQYFPSISQDILINQLSRHIKDRKMIELIRKIIAASDQGIPLGYYISDWISGYYLTGFDHYVKEALKAKLYIRWADDIVIFSSNKRKLHRIKEGIDKYLTTIELQLKDNWRIERFCYGEKPKEKKCKGTFLDFMGFRFYRNRITIRESSFYRVTRKARRIGKKDKPSLYECRQFLSYLGIIKHCDVYEAYKDYIKPYVNIQKIKRRISRHDRKESRYAKDEFQEGTGYKTAA